MVSTAIIVLALLITSLTDLLLRIIPNSVCAVIALVGIYFQVSHAPIHVVAGIIQALATLAILLPAWGKGFIGGGDAKLLIALASGLSFPEFVRTLFDMVVAGGALGCLYLVLSRLPMELPSYSGPSRLRHALAAERSRILTRESIPYGVAIALGWICAVVPHRLEGAAWPFAS